MRTRFLPTLRAGASGISPAPVWHFMQLASTRFQRQHGSFKEMLFFPAVKIFPFLSLCAVDRRMTRRVRTRRHGPGRSDTSCIRTGRSDEANLLPKNLSNSGCVVNGWGTSANAV